MLASSLGCGGSSPQPQPPAPRLSQGLKIFATRRVHGADFRNDPYLAGDTAVAKADDFCGTDPNKPDASTYRALLVDGVIRDAKTRTNWVLAPSTTYYRPYDDVVIGATTPAAIFGAVYAALPNAIDLDAAHTLAWTGIGSAADFAAGYTCNGWSDLTNSYSGNYGQPFETDGTAFSTNGRVGCYAYQFKLYCVEQP
jgi:hypothetical protein